MRVTELKALARDRGLRNYSWMRKAELVALLQNNPSPLRIGGPARSTALRPQLKLGTPLIRRGLPPNKKWIYLNDKK